MKEKIVFELNSVYRDNMRIKGYSFGEGENSACIVGATRGNEVQQLYICSRLINIFKQLEHQGKIKYGKSVMVIPTVNSHSMNIGKRFWSTDNTDINRMFPGYNLGETTQRIAAGVFENISSYQYGIQFTSFYMQGDYIPHVRVMQTGFEDIELAKDFGLPYVFRRNARPYDTTTLNYNWQLWGAKAFSVYTSATDSIDIISAREAINAVLSFLNKQGIIQYRCHEGYISQFMTPDSCDGYELTMRGTLDGSVFVSSDFMFVTCNYAKEGEQYGISITMLFDMETFTIYELNIDTTYLTDSVTEKEIPLYSVIPYSETYEQELSDALIKYWGVSSDSITVNVSPESFSINIYSQPFLEYNNINSEQFDIYG